MRACAVLLVVVCAGLLGGCGGADAVPTASTVPVVEVREAQAVKFKAQDGVELSGTLQGGGPVAVIFSHMSDGSRGDWRELPEEMARKGYTTLAYDFRGRGESGGTFSPPSADMDLRAALEYARGMGAKRWVFVGASMGSMASAKVAATETPAAVVLVAGTTSWSGLSVSDAEMGAIRSPKLFINSEADGFIEGFTQLYRAAADPKEKYIYPGALHGTDLFLAEGEVSLRKLISDFIEKNAPPQ